MANWFLLLGHHISRSLLAICANGMCRKFSFLFFFFFSLSVRLSALCVRCAVLICRFLTCMQIDLANISTP